jgi:hypothetical protein
MPVDRPTFILHLRPEAHCEDHIKALRATLKRALRDYGLRCTTIKTTDSVGVVLETTNASTR